MRKVFKYIFAMVLCGLVTYSFTSCDDNKNEDPQPETEKNKEGENSEKFNGELVDLGLSVKWAACNIGADSPEEYGNYYAWGELETKNDYSEENSATYGLLIEELQAKGIINEDTVLNEAYDVAHVRLDGSWRMPTKAEYEELIEKCTWNLTVSGNGVFGYTVTGPNGNSILLPDAGFCVDSSCYDDCAFLLYWTSNPFENSKSSYYLSDDCINTTDRSCGLPIRPVAK